MLKLRDIQYYLMNLTAEEFHKLFLGFYQNFDSDQSLALDIYDFKFILE